MPTSLLWKTAVWFAGQGASAPEAPQVVTNPTINTPAPQEDVQIVIGRATWTGTVDSFTLELRYASDDTVIASWDENDSEPYTYTPDADDVGEALYPAEVASNVVGDSDEAVGTVTDMVVPALPANSSAPTISTSTPTVGTELTVTKGSWTGTVDGIALTLRYVSDDTIIAQSGDTFAYTPVTADIGETLYASEVATNAAGNSSAAESSATDAVAEPGSVPVNAEVPSIAGYEVVGFSWEIDVGTWTNSPSSYTVDLYDDSDDSLVASDVGTTPTVLSAWAGKALYASVVATNLTGDSSAAVSTATAVILADLSTQMLALSGLLAYFPQTEASGTTADNAEGTAARDATFYPDANVTQQGATFPVGTNVALYDDTGRLRFGTADLAAAWNWENFYIILWALPNATEQADANNHYWGYMTGAAGTTRITISKKNTGAYYMGVDHRPNASSSGSRIIYTDWFDSPNFLMLAVAVDSGAVGHVWRNGVPVYSRASIVASTTDTLDVSNADYNILASGIAAAGAFPHLGLGSNADLSDAIVNNLFRSVYPGVQDVFICGDSYATDNDYWIAKTLSDLERAGTFPYLREAPYRVGLSGQKAADLNAYFGTTPPALTDRNVLVILNVGANDISGGTAESTFKTEYQGIIDKLRAAKANIPIGVTKPYRADGSYDAAAANMAGWIDDLIAANTNVFVANDQTDWFKTGIATYSSDNIHYNDAGAIVAAAVEQANITAFFSPADPDPFIKALFATDKSTGFAAPYLTEQGRVRRSADSSSIATVSGGDFVLNGTADTNYVDPAYYLDNGVAFKESSYGRTYLFAVTPSATDEIVQIGQTNAATITTSSQTGIRFYSDGKIYYVREGTAWAIGAYGVQTYHVALRQRDTGLEIWIKGGVYLSWTLLFIDTSNPDSGSFAPCMTIAGTTDASISDVIATYIDETNPDEVLDQTSPTKAVWYTGVNEGTTLIEFAPPASPNSGDKLTLNYNVLNSTSRRLIRFQWNSGTGQWDVVTGHVDANVETLQGAPIANVGELTRIAVRVNGWENTFWGAVSDDFTNFYGDVTDALWSNETTVYADWTGSFTNLRMRAWDGHDATIDAELDTAVTL